jgi:squalene-hopene/tetraprenyl-beta-curcumene cyclase
MCLQSQVGSRTSCLVAVAFVLATAVGGCAHHKPGSPYSWNANAAAHYLDQREAKWATWQGAARDHGTFCVSCHTALSYALIRPAIFAPGEQQTGNQEEQQLIEDVQKRVGLWNQIGPYYRGKDDESRGTESVLNALILATNDARTGAGLSEGTRAAFDHMWALQQTTAPNAGAWSWLQFRQEPWEARDSNYYGACLAGLAVGTAPGDYLRAVPIQKNVALLREYLDGNFGTQPDINKVTLLWASLKWPGLVSPQVRQSIIDEIYNKQRTDGGWSLATLVGNWKRTDGTPLVLESDGYATGLITYVLQESGVPQDNQRLRRGLKWLSENQSSWDGHWSAYSLNRRRHDPFSNVSQFMNDAATAYAALSLSTADQNSGGSSAAMVKTARSGMPAE